MLSALPAGRQVLPFAFLLFYISKTQGKMTDTIQINDKEYPVRISHKAIKQFRIVKKRGIETLGQEPGDLEFLLLEGLRIGAKAENQKLDITLDAIDDWLDEDMVGNMEKISEVINRAFPDADNPLTIEQVYGWLKADEKNLAQLQELIKDGVPEQFPESLKN